MKQKKAQGLSISVVVIALIALVVLIIVVLMIFRGADTFQQGLADCKARGGRACINQSQEQCRDNEVGIPGICNGDLICCIPG